MSLPYLDKWLLRHRPNNTVWQILQHFEQSSHLHGYMLGSALVLNADTWWNIEFSFSVWTTMWRFTAGNPIHLLPPTTNTTMVNSGQIHMVTFHAYIYPSQTPPPGQPPASSFSPYYFSPVSINKHKEEREVWLHPQRATNNPFIHINVNIFR